MKALSVNVAVSGRADKRTFDQVRAAGQKLGLDWDEDETYDNLGGIFF